MQLQGAEYCIGMSPQFAIKSASLRASYYLETINRSPAEKEDCGSRAVDIGNRELFGMLATICNIEPIDSTGVFPIWCSAKATLG